MWDTLNISEYLFINWLGVDEKLKLTDFFNKKTFRVADTSLTYRQISNLDKDGLLAEERDEDGWRKFSFKEAVYLLIVGELKQYGLSHEQLRPLWQSFFGKPAKREDGLAALSSSIGETAIGCVFGKVEILVVIDQSGQVGFFDPANYAVFTEGLFYEMPSTYLLINLNKFVNKILKDMKKEPIPPKWSVSAEYIKSAVLDVTEKENKLLEIIRNQDYQSIRIKKKDGQISVVYATATSGEASKADLTDKDVAKLLKARDFQDISIVKRDGKVVNLTIEETIKL